MQKICRMQKYAQKKQKYAQKNMQKYAQICKICKKYKKISKNIQKYARYGDSVDSVI